MCKHQTTILRLISIITTLCAIFLDTPLLWLICNFSYKLTIGYLIVFATFGKSSVLKKIVLFFIGFVTSIFAFIFIKIGGGGYIPAVLFLELRLYTLEHILYDFITYSLIFILVYLLADEYKKPKR